MDMDNTTDQPSAAAAEAEAPLREETSSTTETKSPQSDIKDNQSTGPSIVDQLTAAACEGIKSAASQLPRHILDLLINYAFNTAATGPAQQGAWDPLSVVDSLNSRGMPSDMDSRSALWKSFGFEGPYSGTARQNNQLRMMVQRKF